MGRHPACAIRASLFALVMTILSALAWPAAAENLRMTFANEERDVGVLPIDRIRTADFHAPTPTTVPGAYVPSAMACQNAGDRSGSSNTQEPTPSTR